MSSKSPTPAVRRRMKATDPAHRATGGAVGASGSSGMPSSRGRGSADVTVELSTNEPSRSRDDHAVTSPRRADSRTLTSADAQKTYDDEEAEPARDRYSGHPWSSATQGQGNADGLSHQRRGITPAAHPAGQESFIAFPLSLVTIDGLPHSRASPERSATLPKERHQTDRVTRKADRRAVARVPVRLHQQHPVNHLHRRPIMTLSDAPGRVRTGRPASIPARTDFPPEQV